MTFVVLEGAEGTRFVGDTDFGPIVEHLSRTSGVGINSHARDQAAADLLHSIGLHTQAEVIELHARRVPGFGPANPVERTSHCCFNDGVVRPDLPPGAALPAWQRGIDTRDSAAFCQAARRAGLIVTLTYPGSREEGQHVNCHTQVHSGVAGLPTLHPGDREHPRRVWRLSQLLMEISRPGHSRALSERYLHHHFEVYEPQVVRALRECQRDHHLDDDGVVGWHTWMQLLALEQHFKQVDAAAAAHGHGHAG
jgi:hypothetical protein